MTPDEIKAALRRSRDYLDPNVLDFVAAVTARYMATGKDLTVPEIAECLGWGEAKVRKLLARHGGCPNGLGSRQDERPSYSKSYRAMQSGVHKVWTYGPTRETLRTVALFSSEEARLQAALIGRLENQMREWGTPSPSGAAPQCPDCGVAHHPDKRGGLGCTKAAQS